MNPKLILYTFTYGEFSMDINVSLEEHNVYMKQIEIAELLGISKATVSRIMKKYDISKWDSVADLQHFCNNLTHPVAEYYGLKIIKEIGQKYNPDRIQKLEEWLEQIIIENSQELVDDNFEIVRYNRDKLNISVRYDKVTNQPWLTQKEISVLYGTTKQSVGQHIKNIFEDEELDKNSVVKNYFTTGIDGKTYEVMLYSYDMILAIGYRTRTSKAASFRNWATSIITKYTELNYKFSNTNNVSIINNEYKKKVDRHDEEIKQIQNAIDNLNPANILYSKNDSYDAYLKLSLVISTATKEVIIIDPYADRFVISLLGLIRNNIDVYIILNNISRITNEEIEIFKRVHPNTQIRLIEDKNEHDRFIFIDRQIGLNIGQSINTLGYCKVTIMRIDDIDFINKKIKEYFE